MHRWGLFVFGVQRIGGIIVNYSLDFLRGMHGAPAEAADEIERLRARVNELEAVLGALQQAPCPDKYDERWAEAEQVLFGRIS